MALNVTTDALDNPHKLLFGLFSSPPAPENQNALNVMPTCYWFLPVLPWPFSSIAHPRSQRSVCILTTLFSLPFFPQNAFPPVASRLEHSNGSNWLSVMA
ncbi:hypothetical protein TcCL_ESM06696, partial [Trypanosoma cruzi]